MWEAAREQADDHVKRGRRESARKKADSRVGGSVAVAGEEKREGHPSEQTDQSGVRAQPNTSANTSAREVGDV